MIVGLLALAAFLFALRLAHADGTGSAALGRADAALFKKDYASAASLYTDALEAGGLSVREALQAWTNLGMTEIALGREKESHAAFVNAAMLDPHFILPRDAGRHARGVADDARRSARTTGAYQLTIEAPETVQPGRPFHVAASMSAAHAALVSKVRLTAIDPTSDAYFEKVESASTTVGFDVPGTMTLPDRRVALRVEAVDAHDNRLVVVSAVVKIAAGGAPSAPRGDGGVDSEPEGGAPPPSSATVITTKTDGEGDEGDASGPSSGPWSVPHGSKQYAAVRTETSPVIDGVLDDAIWTKAPKDNRFFSTRSKPYGQPTTEPTTVQVAYDDQYLYVAFRCTYGKPGKHDTSFASDEQTLIDDSESVSVIVDPVHGHTGAYQFVVSPAGARGDAEISEQGAAVNLDFRDIVWESGTARTADGGWTAEFKIPWGSMRMPSHDQPFDLGVNFARREPTSGEYSLWALHPPATEFFDTNYFGHLEGLSQAHPNLRFYFEPYLAMAVESAPQPSLSALQDFTGGNGNFRLYAGAYLRIRPPGPVRVDATFNPDFSSVNPDQALANFDRFELEFPEARPFFAEDNPRFAFGAPRYLYGDLGAQLFYSRRLGIDTNTSGITQAVPILWGVKSVLREGGTEAALMNVETSPAHRTISLSDNDTVGRVTQTYEGQRIGLIFLNRAGDSGAYTAGGVDGTLAFYDRHLTVSGFYSASKSSALDLSGAGEGTLSWKSQDFYAQGTYMDIGKSFDAPLGYFPITGVQSEQFAAGYTPVLRNDLVQQAFLEAQLSLVRDRDTNARVYDRGVISASVQTIQQATIQVAVQPAIENVTTPFPIGNGRITIPVGQYDVMVTSINFTSPQRKTIVWGLGYTGGDLFDGQRKAPSATFGVNLGRFSARTTYTMFILSEGTESFTGHELDFSASYAFTPRAKTTFIVDANTVAARANATFVTSLQFWTASQVSLTMRAVSGSTIDTPAQDWSDNPDFSAILSLSLGLSPF